LKGGCDKVYDEKSNYVYRTNPKKIFLNIVQALKNISDRVMDIKVL